MQNKNAFIAVLVVIVIALVGYIVWGNAQKMEMQKVTEMQVQTTLVEQNQQTNSVSTNAVTVKGSTSVIDPNNPDVTTYTSHRLGIQFSYINKMETGQKGSATNPLHTVTLPNPTESGNVIDLLGHTITVFDKNPDVSFEDSIKTHFLVGYSPKDCFVKLSPSSVKGYQNATISYPPPTVSGEPFWANADKCPENYSETNGVQGFIYNTEQPDRFAFLKGGQDVAALSPDKKYDFLETVRIIAKQ